MKKGIPALRVWILLMLLGVARLSSAQVEIVPGAAGGSGGATATNQTNGGQKTQIVDSVGNVIASTSNNLNVQCANCTGSGVVATDTTSFTETTSLFAPSGGYYKSSFASLTTGQQGAVALTQQRGFHVTFYTAAGVEQLGQKTTAASIPVALASDATLPVTNAGTFAVQASIADAGDTTQGAKADNRSAATDTTAVTLMSVFKQISFMEQNPASRAVTNAGTFAVQAAQSGAWNITNISGTVSLPTGASTAAKQPALGTTGVASADVITVQGIAAMTPLLVTPSLPALASTSTKQSDGTQKTQLVDSLGNVIASTSNNLNVQCANCTGTGVSAQDEATFTAGTSLLAPSGGFFQTTPTNNALTTGQQGMFQTTSTRALFVNFRNNAGTEIGTSTTPIEVTLANTGANGTAVKTNIASGGIASGAIASGAVASGAVASGAFASGAIGSGAIASGAIASGAVASGAFVSGSVADGAVVTLGAKTDAKSTATDATSITVMQVLKEISAMAQAPAALPAGQSVDVAKVGGTNTVTAGVNGAQATGGCVATNVAITCNPNLVAAQAVSSENSAATTSRAVQLVADLVGKLIVMPYANPENFLTGTITTAMTSTTSTVFSGMGAQGGSLRVYVTGCTVSNAHATVGTDVILQDGSGGTTLYTIPAAPAYGGGSPTFPTPLKTTANNALYAANVTTGASTKVSCTGYKGI